MTWVKWWVPSQVSQALLVFILWVSVPCMAQEHTYADRNYMASLFDGVWFMTEAKENVLIRIEPIGLSVLIGEEIYLRGAEVVDINRDEKAITFSRDEELYTISRMGDMIRFRTPDGEIYRAERSRRLTKQDIETLDFWYQFKPDPCGLFNQHCDDESQ